MERVVNYYRTWKEILQRAGVPYKERSTGVFVISCTEGHEERTPSLHCWPLSGRYHCHGCEADGDIREFMQRIFDVHDDFMQHKWRTFACYTFLPNEREMIMEELRQHGKAPDMVRKMPASFPQGNAYTEYARLCNSYWYDLNVE